MDKTYRAKVYEITADGLGVIVKLGCSYPGGTIDVQLRMPKDATIPFVLPAVGDEFDVGFASPVTA